MNLESPQNTSLGVSMKLFPERLLQETCPECGLALLTGVGWGGVGMGWGWGSWTEQKGYKLSASIQLSQLPDYRCNIPRCHRVLLA